VSILLSLETAGLFIACLSASLEPQLKQEDKRQPQGFKFQLQGFKFQLQGFKFKRQPQGLRPQSACALKRPPLTRTSESAIATISVLHISISLLKIRIVILLNVTTTSKHDTRTR
jgi:hypothetical protein